MRIIAGKYKFRNIKSSGKIKFSPILSSVRENIFNILNFELDWTKTVVADVFTGSGILGLEALSRGARFCYFNDVNTQSIQNLNQYLKDFNATNAQTTHFPYQQFLVQCYQQCLKLDLIFITPPYDKPLYANETLTFLLKHRLLNSEALVIVQLDQPFVFKHSSLLLFNQKKYGRTCVYFYRFAPKLNSIPKLIFHNKKLLIISGPSGVGKKTVIQKLINDSGLNLAYSISCTTRSMRVREKDHVDYHFLTKTAFKTAIIQNSFLEYARYIDHFYGTLYVYVQRLLDREKNVLLEVEIEGAMAIKKQYPEAIWIYIYPPNLAELESRIKKRGTETETEIKHRLIKTQSEMQFVFGLNVCDLYVENNTINQIITEIKAFIAPQIK